MRSINFLLTYLLTYLLAPWCQTWILRNSSSCSPDQHYRTQTVYWTSKTILKRLPLNRWKIGRILASKLAGLPWTIYNCGSHKMSLSKMCLQNLTFCGHILLSHILRRCHSVEGHRVETKQTTWPRTHKGISKPSHIHIQVGEVSLVVGKWPVDVFDLSPLIVKLM